ncbi:hypothetical protein EC843_102140 [Buttiauxella sp. JUb87]|uniref:hypothetical protein n=1 Tax=Buttiauxella sp. JUb87 TaxID=2485129 RepID=UPI00105B75B3|nr:hypothetical protein [Buttiauxella sp. JUb87]TDN52709.1 hypothetical protein EC843_102140 [Buttiauxella sp. JUb87]
MKALALFGSTARHERDFNSDIDLLGVYDGSAIRSVNRSIVSLFLYPEDYLVEKMTTGDLFALHLVKESTAIYGADVLQNIFDNFRYKDSYGEDICTAIYLANSILKEYAKINNKKEANKKIVWCLRTIIISLSAQDRTPVFSKKSLSEYIKLDKITARDILTMIDLKTSSMPIPLIYLNLFHDFFYHFEIKFASDMNGINRKLITNCLINLGIISGSSNLKQPPYI